MGYTQYWNTSTDATPEAKKKMEQVTLAVIATTNIIIKDGMGENAPIVTMDEIWLNGDASTDEEFETFGIDFNSGLNGLCKTNRHPYDEVVVALLIAGKKLGIIHSWKSDGGYPDFKAGKILLEKALTSLGITL